ncbi:MAG: hypothetical protein QM790_10810 [Nibricoccus sp.]
MNRMSEKRRKLIARLILVAIALVGAIWAWRFDYSQRVSTDVLDLVPADEREPELAMVRQMADDRVARVVLVALKTSRKDGEANEAYNARREKITVAFAEKLRQSPAFAEVVRLGDTRAFAAVGVHVFNHRFDLLLPGVVAMWKNEYKSEPPKTSFSEWAAEKTASELTSFLAQPEAMAFQELLPSDPLLLMPRALEPWQAFSGLAGGGEGNGYSLIWARTGASPLSQEGQKPVFEAMTDAEAAAKSAGNFELRWTGIGRFAEASRRRIEGEMSGLNTLSLIVVMAIGFAGVRRPYKALHLAPVLLFSLLGAWVVTTTVFPRVHVLVFVVGSLLGGVAVDYGFYLFLQPPQTPDESPMSKAGRLLRPLLTSSLTAVTGFLLLLFSDLPLIRHLGVFVSAGLVFALIAALLWFAQAGDNWWETRAFIRARLSGTGIRNFRRVLVLVACVVVVVGLLRLRWHDDIRDLDISSPELRKNAEEVQALFGESDSRTLYVTRGATAQEARRSLQAFHDWDAKQFPSSKVVSVGSILPLPEDRKDLDAALAELSGFEDALRGALERHGFDVVSFEPFFTAWRDFLKRDHTPSYDELVAGLRDALTGPLGLMMEARPGSNWFVSLADHPNGAEPPKAVNTISSDQLSTLNHLFARYRMSALVLSAIGLGLVGVSVFVVYGISRGIFIFMLPAGSCLFAFGLFGLTGETLNLFHLLGAFLGVCLSHNYAIFSYENAARGDTAPPSIRLSALTTAASFGVLALSHIAVIAALGKTVAVIVLTALCIVELNPFSKQLLAKRE